MLILYLCAIDVITHTHTQANRCEIDCNPILWLYSWIYTVPRVQNRSSLAGWVLSLERETVVNLKNGWWSSNMYTSSTDVHYYFYRWFVYWLNRSKKKHTHKSMKVWFNYRLIDAVCISPINWQILLALLSPIINKQSGGVCSCMCKTRLESLQSSVEM